ncbi:MAG: hypothetical protein NZ602_13180 [Thermoguttaceae bacterium]|nr:hypothetical protein [Thermoguttaceae bacterium]
MAKVELRGYLKRDFGSLGCAKLFPPPAGATAQDLGSVATQSLHRPLGKEDWASFSDGL